MSVYGVARSATHEFSKTPVPTLTLLPGLGVEGDCHSGVHVRHRSRLHINPPPPNLRQVHLIPKEILDVPGVEPGQIGENITTVGLDLLSLGVGTKLHFFPAEMNGGELDQDDEERLLSQTPPHPVIVLQGLRNPCPQIDKFRPGLKETFIVRNEERNIVERTAGVMGTVEAGGLVTPNMKIVIEDPKEFLALGCV